MDYLSALEENRRFDEGPALAELAMAMNPKDATALLQERLGKRPNPGHHWATRRRPMFGPQARS